MPASALGLLGGATTPTPVLSVGSLLGVVVAALASLVVAAGIVVYLVRNSPETFTVFRKLRPEPDSNDEEYDD